MKYFVWVFKRKGKSKIITKRYHILNFSFLSFNSPDPIQYADREQNVRQLQESRLQSLLQSPNQNLKEKLENTHSILIRSPQRFTKQTPKSKGKSQDNSWGWSARLDETWSQSFKDHDLLEQSNQSQTILRLQEEINEKELQVCQKKKRLVKTKEKQFKRFDEHETLFTFMVMNKLLTLNYSK